MKRLVAKTAHLHPCSHYCFCYDPTAAECRGCLYERFQAAQVEFNRRLMSIRPEDSQTTEQLLTRRA
jgi:hypothetical protein